MKFISRELTCQRGGLCMAESFEEKLLRILTQKSSDHQAACRVVRISAISDIP